MTQLIVMRLADMALVHPDQITAQCSGCGEAVGVYPSGQKVMLEFPDVELICQVCRTPGAMELLAPGAAQERFQSRPNPLIDFVRRGQAAQRAVDAILKDKK